MRHICDVQPEDLGPFLLGQLGHDEALLVAEAVSACPTCTQQVGQLEPVVAALARVSLPLDDAPALAPSPSLERVLATVRSERAASRRRLRTRVSLVAAAVILLVGAVVGALVVGGGETGGRELALTGHSSATGSAIVAQRGWGTSVTLDVRGLRPGRTYGAWLADSKGARVPAGTFRATTDGTAHLDLAASLTLEDVRTVGVTLIGGADVLSAHV
jgi:hypothetical protein